MTIPAARVTLMLMLAALASGPAMTDAAAGSTVRVPAWANEFLGRWYIHYNRGDSADLAAMFSPDANFGPDHGRPAIEASMAADFRKTRYHCEGRYDGVRELGELAVAWGRESCAETSRTDNATVRTYERWLLSEETYAPTDAGGT